MAAVAAVAVEAAVVAVAVAVRPCGLAEASTFADAAAFHTQACGM